MDKGFGLTCLETRLLEEIAKVDQDNLPLEESSPAYAYSLQSSSVHIQGTNGRSLLCLARWRAVVTEDDRGKPSGRGFDEVSGSRLLRGSRCEQSSSLSTFHHPHPPTHDCDLGAKGLDEDELPEKLVRKNVARSQPPRFTLPRSLEYE